MTTDELRVALDAAKLAILQEIAATAGEVAASATLASAQAYAALAAPPLPRGVDSPSARG